MARDGLRDEKNRSLIYGDDVIPFLLWKFGKRMTAPDPGVIYQDVNGANIFFDMFNRSLNILFMSDIKGGGNSLYSFLLKFHHGCFGAFRRNIVNDNARAIATQAGCQQITNSLRGSGDKDIFTCQ